MRGAPMLTVGGALLLAVSFVGLVGPPARSTPPGPPPACRRPDQAPGFESRARFGVVPDVTCMDLQLARDKAHAAGFTNVASDDAAGRHRHLQGREWVVVGQSPPAGNRSSPGTRLVFRALAFGDPGAPPVPERSQPGRVPRLTCFDLQEARDTLESAGFTVMRSQDATGRRRRQIVDRDWTVTGQTPAAGGLARRTTTVMLRAIKDGEPSPCQ